MGRHVDLRDPTVLVAVVAAVLVCVLAAMMGLALAANPKVGMVAQEASAPADARANESSDDRAVTPALRQGEDEMRVGHEETRIETPRRVGKRPAAFVAGEEVSDAELEESGGADAFFWVEEISEAVFARMEGKSFGADCTTPVEDLRYLRVLHADAEGRRLVGELVCNRVVADELLDIFRQLYEAGYPIRKMHLVDDYGASDDASIADDNTSCFNFRLIAGTSMLSNHARGLAIDINPFENPYVNAWGEVVPAAAAAYADRTMDDPYVLHTDDLCFRLFESYGWSWGGYWESPIDYQHFEKPDA